MLAEIANLSHRAKTAIDKLLSGLDTEFTEEVLEMLLTVMSLVFLISSDYRKNIEGFDARYVFKGRDNSFAVSAVFHDGKMEVTEEIIENSTITINFKNPAALRNFIFSPKPDILNAILKQEVTFEGNLNYLYKFAYMANQLKVMAQELIQ